MSTFECSGHCSSNNVRNQVGFRMSSQIEQQCDVYILPNSAYQNIFKHLHQAEPPVVSE